MGLIWKNITAVIFDMDGLLVDTEPLHYEATNLVLEEYGKVLTPQVNERFIGLGDETFWPAVATYLHRHRGMRISDVIDTLRGVRSPMVLCNSTFETRLREWYGEPDELDFEPFDMEKWIVERTGGRSDWK